MSRTTHNMSKRDKIGSVRSTWTEKVKTCYRYKLASGLKNTIFVLTSTPMSVSTVSSVLSPQSPVKKNSS